MVFAKCSANQSAEAPVSDQQLPRQLVTQCVTEDLPLTKWSEQTVWWYFGTQSLLRPIADTHLCQRSTASSSRPCVEIVGITKYRRPTSRLLRLWQPLTQQHFTIFWKNADKNYAEQLIKNDVPAAQLAAAHKNCILRLKLNNNIMLFDQA